MLREGENREDFEQLHQELTEEWQPGYVTEAMLVKSIAEKSFDLAQLRAAWTESRLNSLRITEIQAQRQELLTRRWLPGQPPVKRELGGLWLAKDSPAKFKGIFDRLDLIEKWCEAQTCPAEYRQTMIELYGECPSLAGEKSGSWLWITSATTKQRCATPPRNCPSGSSGNGKTWSGSAISISGRWPSGKKSCRPSPRSTWIRKKRRWRDRSASTPGS
ncbi:MAG: hypothetical protein ACLQOO_29090 [Terriglobia bacterium]